MIVNIEKFIRRLGEGLCSPVAYDTAWVARIPLLNALDQPAFPKSIEWLRRNQLQDGSWGTAERVSPHANTLSTLAVIVALAQWKNPEDQPRINKGIQALWDWSRHLASELHEGAAFELILPALLEDAEKYGLREKLPIEVYNHKRYTETADKKRAHLNMALIKYGSNQPATWWFSLELLGDSAKTSHSSLRFSESMFTANGSLALSPAATAYILLQNRLQGRDLPEAEHYLKQLASQNDDGIPDHAPIDLFELAFALDFFLQAGISAKDPILKPAIDQLAKHWDDEQGIGFSQYWKMSDADDTAIALYVLHQAGHPATPSPLLKFYNGICIAGYIGESTHSISVNINALKTLLLFQGQPEVDIVINKILAWLEKQTYLEDSIFIDDKWNISPFYCASRAVFSIPAAVSDIAKNCINFLLNQQNTDGGWGKNNASTFEETSYACLALCYWVEQGHVISEKQLTAAYNYLTQYNDSAPLIPLWTAKVLYCPTLIVQSAILAAHYAVNNTLKLLQIKKLLSNEQHLLKLNLSIDNLPAGKTYFPGILLSFLPETDITHFDLAEVRKHAMSLLKDFELNKVGDISTPKDSLESMAYTLYKGEITAKNRMTEVTLYLIVYLYDVFIDKGIASVSHKSAIVKQAFDTFIQILEGTHQNFDTIKQDLDFPKFIPLCNLLFKVREQLVKQQADMSLFLFGVREYHTGYVQKFMNRINNVQLTAEQHIEIAEKTFAVHMFCGMHYIFANIKLTEAEKTNKDFIEFQKCAFKAGRLLGDLFSFAKDLAGCKEDNYVLVKANEPGISLIEAFSQTVELCNRLMLRMLFLEETLNNNPATKNSKALHGAIKIFKEMIQGIIDWSSKTKRYQIEGTYLTIERIPGINTTMTMLTAAFKNVVTSEKYRIFNNSVNQIDPPSPPLYYHIANP